LKVTNIELTIDFENLKYRRSLGTPGIPGPCGIPEKRIGDHGSSPRQETMIRVNVINTANISMGNVKSTRNEYRDILAIVMRTRQAAETDPSTFLLPEKFPG